MLTRSAKLGRLEGTGEFWMREVRPGGPLDGAGSFTFPEGMTFAEADGAFVLGEPVAYEGLMHDQEGLVPGPGPRHRVRSELRRRRVVCRDAQDRRRARGPARQLTLVHGSPPT